MFSKHSNVRKPVSERQPFQASAVFYFKQAGQAMYVRFRTDQRDIERAAAYSIPRPASNKLAVTARILFDTAQIFADGTFSLYKPSRVPISRRRRIASPPEPPTVVCGGLCDEHNRTRGHMT